jgi:hypothetical protein
LAVQELQHIVQALVIQVCHLAKHVRALKDALSDRFGDFLSQEQKLVLVRVQSAGQLHDQLVAGKFAERELLVLDLAQVCAPSRKITCVVIRSWTTE